MRQESVTVSGSLVTRGGEVVGVLSNRTGVVSSGF